MSVKRFCESIFRKTEGNSKKFSLNWIVFFMVNMLLIAVNLPTFGQDIGTHIQLDGTVGNKDLKATTGRSDGVIDSSGGEYSITENHGERQGHNLYHSFKTFHIGSNGPVKFTADETQTTNNVISRVTGGATSHIYGTLDSSEILNANFFFLNPAGVIFGKGAKINVDGSFHVSSADYLKFEDGKMFYASENDIDTSILTTASPSAFGFLGNEMPGRIEFKGKEGDIPFVIGYDKPLVIGYSELIDTFSVIGGEVTLKHTTVMAEQIKIASCYLGEVYFQDDQLAMETNSIGGIVNLSDSVIRADAGGVLIRGGKFINKGTRISGLGIDIEASQIELNNGYIDTDVPNDSLKPTPPIKIKTSKIDFESSSKITTSTFKDVDTGNVTIESDEDLTIAPKDNGATLNIEVTGDGKTGDVKILSKNGSVNLDSLLIKTNTSGENTSGNLNINAKEMVTLENIKIWADTMRSAKSGPVTVEAKDIILRNSEITGQTMSGSGSASSISFDAENSIIMDSSKISNSTTGGGDGGDISVSAKNYISIDSSVMESLTFPNIFEDQNEATDSGNGGDILISSENSISLKESVINVSTFTKGFAGSVQLVSNDIQLNESSIDANTMGLEGAGFISIEANNLEARSADVSCSSIKEEVTLFKGTEFEEVLNFDGTGNAGTINIRGRKGKDSSISNMTLTDSRITTTAESGEGGAISVQADSATLVSSEISSSVLGGQKNAGSITVVAKELAIKDADSKVSSETHGAGSAGNVTLRFETLESAGEISSSSKGIGNPGTIVIEGRTGGGSFADKISLKESSKVLTTIENKDGGDNSQIGNIEISAREFDMSGSEISSSTAGRGAAGQIILRSDTLNARNSQIVSRSTGEGAAGSIEIGKDDSPIHELRLIGSEISAYAADGPKPNEPREGNISIRSDGFMLMEEGSTITASVGKGLGGNISIERPQIGIVRDESKILAQTEDGTGGRIEIAADLFVQSGNSIINADAGVGTSGDVVIDASIANLESSLVALSTEFLDVAAILKQRCSAETLTESSFVIVRRQGFPLSPEGLIQAFDIASAGWIESPPIKKNEKETEDFDMAQNETARGSSAWRGGNFRKAIEKLSNASAHYQKIGDGGTLSAALGDLGQVQMMAGEYVQATETLRSALALAEKSGDSEKIASALNKLGNAHLVYGDIKGAETLLTKGVQYAKDGYHKDIEVVLNNNLGNLYASEESYEKALLAYQKSARQARTVGEPLNEAKALANASRAALAIGDFQQAGMLVDQAYERTQYLTDTYEKTYLLIHLGSSYNQLAKLIPESHQSYLIQGYAALKAAIELTSQSKDGRLNSYALGNLADLYRTENRFKEALFLTRKARRLAEALEVSELIYRWHWLEGQCLWAQGATYPAIEAYQRAIDVLEETRQEVLGHYGSGEVYFRNLVAPVYIDMIDALLKASERVSSENSRQSLWKKARDTVELMKGAELRNYFKDECITELDAKKESLEKVAEKRENVAVVYPILLTERMALLVTTQQGLKLYFVPDVGKANVTVAVKRLYEAILDKTKEYKEPCQNLYDWLVRPYEKDLNKKINTLVFVPGDILRTIPIAALHDGNQFLVEKFALAISPGLELVKPEPLRRGNPSLLLLGVSEEINFSLEASESIESYDALPKVEDELRDIQRFFGGKGNKLLLNSDFTEKNFKAAVAETKPSIVHIASHAKFTGDPNESFILAYNEKIKIDPLSRLIGLAKFREDPIELLMLSACKTAMGDERAALGLAGIGVKAGARSAIGSLWEIEDDLAYELVVTFYKKLKENPDISKAEALRQAQLKLLGSGYLHPRHWSPFIVISNWL